MNNKGFTLIELLVVVLIIGILAAMAMPQYFKAVERSRMSEAVTLLGNIAQAQQRKYLQTNNYVTKYQGLDVAPKGATGSVYFTKGNPTTGANGNGFAITLTGDAYTAGIATADRSIYGSTGASGSTIGAGKTNLQYDYTLSRYYASNDVTCKGNNANGVALCNDFCGIDTLTGASGSCCTTGAASACAAPVTGNETTTTTP